MKSCDYFHQEGAWLENKPIMKDIERNSKIWLKTNKILYQDSFFLSPLMESPVFSRETNLKPSTDRRKATPSFEIYSEILIQFENAWRRRSTSKRVIRILFLSFHCLVHYCHVSMHRPTTAWDSWFFPPNPQKGKKKKKKRGKFRISPVLGSLAAQYTEKFEWA